MEEDRKSLYVESTIPSYATARPSKELIAAVRQVMTRDFWEQERHNYDLYVGQSVVDECSKGDGEAVKRRMDFIAGIQVIPNTAEIESLATDYQRLLGIPDRAKTDCIHLAMCVLEHIDYLLTWNCAHLGFASYLKVREYNDKRGLWTPALVTPESIYGFALEEL
jgi:hypothetical protein